MISVEVKYIKTGIDYIPEIPENWKIVRLKNLADVFGRIGFRGYTVADIVDKGQGAISLSPSNIEDQSIIYNNSTYISLEKYYESPEIIVEEGDTILVKTASVGKVALVRNLDDKATINPQLVVFKNYKTDRTYFYYLLTSHLIQKQIERDTSGGVVGTITQQKIKNYWGTLPPLEEQKAIANYLDSQSVQITRFIQTKQRFIELLKEQRQSIITNAVTKGIDEKAKMKETVLGQIPEHWEVRRLKFIAEVNFSTVDKHSHKEEKQVRLCNYVDVYKHEYITNDFDFMVATATEAEIKRFTVEKGDVIITKDSETAADIAIPALVVEDLENVVCAYHLAHIKPNRELMESEFLFRLFQSKKINSHFEVAAKGVTRHGLSYDDINSVFLPYPPTLTEQQEIIKHIKTETRTLDIAISKAEREIELIKEYREAMIAEAVTGKMKL